MIPEIEAMPVKGYQFIDRYGEGFRFVYPEDGEVFIGYPHQHYGDNSQPFIEVKKDGRTIRTVNCADVSQIEFLESEVNDGTSC